VTATKVTFKSSSPLGPLPDLTVSSPLFGLKLLAGGAATTAGNYGTATGQPAVTTAVNGTFGGGALFGFDLTKATTAANAGATLAAAADAVWPAFAKVRAGRRGLDTVSVQMHVTNLGPAHAMRAIETVPAPGVLLTHVPFTIGSCETTNSWFANLGANATANFEYLARVPDRIGTYSVTTVATSTNPTAASCTGRDDDFGASLALGIDVVKDGAALLADANALATSLPASTARTTILQKLSSVGSRAVTVKADAEANLTDLLAAVDQAKTIANAGTVRLALDDLIVYWEARWSAL
jgi:hypothetical protein